MVLVIRLALAPAPLPYTNSRLSLDRGVEGERIASASPLLNADRDPLTIDGDRMSGISFGIFAATHVIRVRPIEHRHHHVDAVVVLCKVCIVKPVVRAGYGRKRVNVS
jgi:hypothetical protein